MHSPAQIEAFRRMTPEERWKITSQLMEFAWRSLLALDPEERERRLEIAGGTTGCRTRRSPRA